MNERFDVIVTILELIGTAAFAASGALTAIKRRFDLFGVIIIGVTTAVGGGIMRDVVIGSHPVAAFRDPLAMSAAALISVLVFAALAVKGDLGGKALKLYDTAMLMLDTIGLGIFTVTGITAAMRSGVSDNTFLLFDFFTDNGLQTCHHIRVGMRAYGSYNRRWGRSSQGYFREQEA